MSIFTVNWEIDRLLSDGNAEMEVQWSVTQTKRSNYSFFPQVMGL